MKKYLILIAFSTIALGNAFAQQTSTATTPKADAKCTKGKGNKACVKNGQACTHPCGKAEEKK